jgi:Zinc finger, C2H2 type/C2H2-type zinc finger
LFQKSKFSDSQISGDQGKHDAMICNRCFNELNAAFEFAEQSQSAEKLYFVKLREEFEAEKQTPEETEETEAVVAEHEEDRKTKREPSIETKTVEIEMFDDSEMIADERSSCKDDEMDSNTGEEEELPQMFALQVATKSSLKLKKVPVSTYAKKIIRSPSIHSSVTSRAQHQHPFQCPICSKALSTSLKLLQHVESVHEKKTRFTCTHCPKKFYHKSSLEIHVAHSHTFTNDDTTNSNRPFECDIDNCGKFFKTGRDLRAHQRTVHSSELSLRKYFPSQTFNFSKSSVHLSLRKILQIQAQSDASSEDSQEHLRIATSKDSVNYSPTKSCKKITKITEIN